MVLEVDGWSCAEIPRPMNVEAYEKAREEFVHYYASIEGVHAIYRFGSVTYPGLSDLDFIVVLDDDYQHRPGTKYTIDVFSPDSLYVLYHPQFFIPRSLFAYVSLLEPVFEMEHVTGSLCPQGRLSPEDRALVDILFVCESLVTDLPLILLGYPAVRKVNLRMAQAKLNLLVKNARMFGRLAGQEVPGVSQFERKITELRRDWFLRSPEENCIRTKEAMGEAKEVISDLASAVGRFAQQLAIFLPLTPNRSRWIYRHGHLRFFFSPANSGLRSEPSRDGRRIDLFVPLGLLLPLIWLSSGKGPLSQYIRNQFDSESPRSTASMDGVVKVAVEAANNHCQFLKAKGIPTGNFRFFGYHADYSPGVRTLLRIVARKFRWRG